MRRTHRRIDDTVKLKQLRVRGRSSVGVFFLLDNVRWAALNENKSLQNAGSTRVCLAPCVCVW